MSIAKSLSGKCGRTVLVALAVLPALVQCANAGTPSNAELIAAMPPGTESVMVQRVARLKAADSLFRDEYGSEATADNDRNIKTVVRAAIERARPAVFAWGASDFQMPPDTGMTGNYNERAIYVVEQSMRDLRKRMEDRIDVEGIAESFEVGGVRVYQGTIDAKSVWGHTMNAAGESWFVAIPNEHTIVSAESRADIEYMLAALKAKKSEIPDRWRSVAEGQDLDSPVVILRAYPAPEKPRPQGMDLFLPPEAAGASHFALTLLSATEANMKISIVAKAPDKAVPSIKELGLSDNQYAWSVTPTGSRIDATLRPVQSRKKPELLTLSWVVLFGACVMI